MMAKILGGFIRLYQKYISSQMPRHCRYYPTCSAYAYEAVKKHGAFKGILLGVWRLLRCNPFSRGGYDPVPDAFTFKQHYIEEDEDLIKARAPER